MFLTTELGMGVQMASQFDQLRELLIEAIETAHRSSRARNAISCWVGCGGQRRTSCSQSRWR